jgi:hypothetical protein
MTDILDKKRGRPRRGHSIETNLKKALTDSGLRPQDLEWVFNRSSTNVCNILNGTLHLSLKDATAFSSYLGRDLNSLFELEQRLIHRRIVCVARAKPPHLSHNLD